MPLSLLVAVALVTAPLSPGDHYRSVTVSGVERSYLVHVPPKYDGKKPVPVVLIFHGAVSNAAMMTRFCGMNEKADEAEFVAVYPNGTGLGGLLLFWNAGAMNTKSRADDVAFVRALLNDLGTLVKIDPKRVYATGMSNGGMMCYRLAAELSDRIAAIAPVAGTMVVEKCNPKRAVPVLHFHGTADTFVPFDADHTSHGTRVRTVDETIQRWVKIDRCNERPKVDDLPSVPGDDTTVQRKVYAHGKNGAEVILYVIHGGGHTWPGRAPIVDFLGKSTKSISANDLIWDFFQRHPLR